MLNFSNKNDDSLQSPKINRNIFILVIALFTFSLLGGLCSFNADKSSNSKITILYTGDCIGEIEPCG